ncbi:MAG TPA: 16S rRNA (uracil(1498)-N(3))-methyltransferase [Cryomorphaceae bacterium]|nr:16S rRNA (uracil(1498)-N(3))-methyltransferase [Cryomorphaceae bacterium]
MHSFWGNRTDKQVHLEPEEVVHATKVLRLTPGAEIFVFDGSGTVYRAAIERVSKKEVVANVLEELPDYGVVSGHLHIAIAPTKNIDRMHFFLEKAVEMGVHAITPIWTFHSERKHWNAEKALKIMKGACTQSHKGTLPVLHPAQTLEAFLLQAHESRRYIATCIDSPKESLVASFVTHPYDSSLVLIGPEGDFSPDEYALAAQNGFHHVHLGPHRLRTETAGIYAVAAFALRLQG